MLRRATLTHSCVSRPAIELRSSDIFEYSASAALSSLEDDSLERALAGMLGSAIVHAQQFFLYKFSTSKLEILARGDRMPTIAVPQGCAASLFWNVGCPKSRE